MKKRNLVIVGTGGMAREIRSVIESTDDFKNEWNVLGWTSADISEKEVDGLPVLGDDEWLLSHTEPIDVVIGVGDGKVRRRIAERLKQNKNISFPVIMAESADVSDSVDIGEGSVIMNNSVLTVNIKLGEFCICNYGCTVGHDCKLEEYVTVNPGAHISGNVQVGTTTTIGVGASIIQGLNIGKETIVGAGAVVIDNVDDKSVVVGVPAKKLEKK